MEVIKSNSFHLFIPKERINLIPPKKGRTN